MQPARAVPVHLRQHAPHRWRQVQAAGPEVLTLDTCPVCFGVWLDAGEIDVLGDAETATPVIGASGALAGVTAAYLWIFPRARLLQTVPFLYIQIKIPAWCTSGCGSASRR